MKKKLEIALCDFFEIYKKNEELSFALTMTKGEQILQTFICQSLNLTNKEESLYLPEFKKIDIAEIKMNKIISILELKVAYLGEFFKKEKSSNKPHLDQNRYNLEYDIKKREIEYKYSSLADQDIIINGLWIIKNIKSSEKKNNMPYKNYFTNESHDKKALIKLLHEKGFEKINLTKDSKDNGEGIRLPNVNNCEVELLFFFK